MSSWIEALTGFIDLRSIPFTAPEGRAMVLLGEDGCSIEVRTAAYEVPLRETGPVRRLRFLGPDDRVLPVVARTRPDRVELDVGGRPSVLVFVDPATLLVSLPEGCAGVLVDTDVPARSFRATGTGGRSTDERRPFGLRWAVGTMRGAFAADSDGRLTARLAPLGGGDVSVLVSLDTAVLRRPVPPLPRALAMAEAGWAAWFDRVPSGTPPAALRAAWVLRANAVRLALDPSRAAIVPSKVGYVAVWQWDAYFHAIGLRHLDPDLARDQIRLALAWQRPDGMLPDVIHDDGVLANTADMVATDVERSLLHVGRKRTDEPRRLLVARLTKPPLTALAAWKLHEAAPDAGFLDEVYQPIGRSHRWWFDHSRPGRRALPIYLHPYSSGIDDSPIWDLGMPTETPDLSAYLALQADHLGLIASALGRRREAALWAAEAQALTDRLVARHWRSSRGAFVAIHRGRPVPSDTALGLLPIVTGRLPDAIASSVARSAVDPARFWPRYPIPSVAVSDPDFDPSTMWRGPTWLFLNSLFVDGFERSGHTQVAARLRDRTLAMVEQGSGMSEFYHPLDGSRPERATATFSGTAALYLDLLLSPRVRAQAGDERPTVARSATAHP